MAGVAAIRSLPNYSIDEDKGPSILGVCLMDVILVAYCLL